MELIIECDNANIDTTHYETQIKIELNNPFMGFINQLEISDIISNIDNEKLLRYMIENNPKLLTDFLKEKSIEVLT